MDAILTWNGALAGLGIGQTMGEPSQKAEPEKPQ